LLIGDGHYGPVLAFPPQATEGGKAKENEGKEREKTIERRAERKRKEVLNPQEDEE
jgi:hypothetical protein